RMMDRAADDRLMPGVKAVEIAERDHPAAQGAFDALMAVEADHRPIILPPFVLSLSKHRSSSCDAKRKNGPSTSSGQTVLGSAGMVSAHWRRERHEPRLQHADRVAAHRGADLVVAEARVEQRLRHLHQLRRVEA